jgi:hypothetical protein
MRKAGTADQLAAEIIDIVDVLEKHKVIETSTINDKSHPS